MATTLEQFPLYPINPATFKHIYVFKNDPIVSGVPTPYWNVKFGCVLFITPIYSNLGGASTEVALTKTIPNNAGVGIFNLQRFIESYTSPQQLSYLDNNHVSEFHGEPRTNTFYFPIHVIDKYSLNDNCATYIEPRGFLEGAVASNLPAQTISGTVVNGGKSMVFNGYWRNDLWYRKVNTQFGYDYETYYAPKGPGSYGILSDAPLIQYANSRDYGVISFFNQILNYLQPVAHISITGHFVNGSTQTFSVTNIDANGGVTTPNPGIAHAMESILFFGIFPGNLRQWSSTFQGWLNTGNLTHYTYHIATQSSKLSSKVHTIVLNCDNQGRKYERIRIGWLNSLGGWDYYTFKMKSTESVKTKRNDWTQIEGTWNKESWNPQGWKGGKKAYTVNAKKKYKVNTDFVNEEEAAWFEFMINSPEHYIIHPMEDWREPQVDKFNSFEKYVTAVRLLSSSYKKKTIANDNVMQYSFEFEESRTLNTQPI